MAKPAPLSQLLDDNVLDIDSQKMEFADQPTPAFHLDNELKL